MRTVVLVHAVPDLANLSISKSQDRVFERGKRGLFPADAVAIEAALQRKSPGDEVVALAWGDEGNREALKKPLAMGVDRAAWTPGDPGAAARALGAEAIVGSTTSPLGASFLPSRIGAELGLGEAHVIHVPPDSATPRMPNALAIMKASKKPIETVEAPPRPTLQLRWATLLLAEEA